MRRAEQGGIFFRLLLLLFFLAIMGLFYIARHPLMRLAGQTWMLDDRAAQSDVIIVLGDDNYYGDRATHAVGLYRLGLAPLVVASGRLLRPDSGVAEIMERDLKSRGVPEAAIVKFPHRAGNTLEEAEALATLIAGKGWKRILVVTSNYHARRARFIFERVLPANIALHVSGTRDLEFDPSHWWEKRSGQKLFFNELVGYVVAWWELRRKPNPATGAAVLALPAANTDDQLYRMVPSLRALP